MLLIEEIYDYNNNGPLTFQFGSFANRLIYVSIVQADDILVSPIHLPIIDAHSCQKQPGNFDEIFIQKHSRKDVFEEEILF